MSSAVGRICRFSLGCRANALWRGRPVPLAGCWPKPGYSRSRQCRGLWMFGRWLSIYVRHLGASLSRQPPLVGVAGVGYPPLGGRMSQSVGALAAEAALWRTVLWGTQWGQLDGPAG